jgi:hypothetical protein
MTNLTITLELTTYKFMRLSIAVGSLTIKENYIKTFKFNNLLFSF